VHLYPVQILGSPEFIAHFAIRGETQLTSDPLRQARPLHGFVLGSPIPICALKVNTMTRRRLEGGDLCAIFVHAGAGYHSHQNEKVHLTAVSDAAKVAMSILKNGGEAKDAVEMAIRLLEDREITNAGFGSNLTLDGNVECDATMVDHFGRSGAVGAILRE